MSITQTPYKISNFIHDIVNNNIIQFTKTELSCGRISSYYADFRQLLGYPELSNYVVSQIIKIIDTITTSGGSYDNIAGIAVAGVPWATLVGNKLCKPVSIIRLSEKTHGKKTAIDGAPIKFDSQVILIEDVLTTGESVINAIRKIHNTGANVIRVICILDRNEGAVEHIKYYFPDIKVTSVLTISTLVSVCSANKLIDDYTAEQIEFYRESGYTETIKTLTRLNEDAKEMEYQKEPVKWHYDNYADVWNLLPEPDKTTESDKLIEHNPLFVDVTNMDDWNEIKYKISVIGSRLRNLVIIFENINDWNGVKQDELLGLHKKFGFNIIYKSSEFITQSYVINTAQYTILNVLNTITTGCKYPNSVLVNGIILNLYIDTNPQPGLVSQLRNAIAKYELYTNFTKLNIHNIFINFIGPGVSELIQSTQSTQSAVPFFWMEFRNYIISIIKNQLLQIKGIIIPYTYIKASTGLLNRQLAIGRLIPLIMDISYSTNELSTNFYLDSSMLTNNTDSDYVESLLAITKAFNSNGFTHLMVGNDLMESNTVIATRIEQYINFIKSIVLQKQSKTFSFIQMSNALQQYGPGTKDLRLIIANKARDFTEKQYQHQQQSLANTAIPTEPVNNHVEIIDERVSIVEKIKEYLFNNTNWLRNIFGVTVK